MRRIKHVCFPLMVLVVVALAVGCDTGAPTGGGQDMDSMARLLDKPEPAPVDEAPQDDFGTPGDDVSESPVEEQQQAQVEQSRRLAGRPGVEPGGYANAIIGARRHILNRVESFAWIHTVRSFQAEHGRLPRDHDEFMSGVVEHYGLDLPWIDEGEEYYYDPNEGQFGELFVVRVEQAPAE